MTTLILYGSYLAVLAAGVAFMHMGFRTSNWKRRELPRRFIGDTSVLGLFALFVLVAGAADLTPWLTWLGQVGGFVVAAIVKVAFCWYDAQRHAALGREGHGNEGQDQ